ncbi:MAG: HAMP domain-containing protein [Myxococcales bacterium]|nr:HAMP domain-containing protein [Myxococcales bacterium]
MSRVPRIGMQLGAAFGGVIVLFALMLALTLIALAQLDEAEREVALLDHAKHAAHIAEAQVRELHLWQARLVISRDATRAPRYRAAVKRTRGAIDDVARAARAFAPREVERLGALVGKLDRRFVETMLPRLSSAAPGELARAHDALVKLTSKATQVNAQLSSALNARAARARAEADRLRASTRRAALGTFGGAVLLAIGLAFYLGRRIAGRVAALRSGAERVAAGDLSTTIELPGGDDELVQLARAFNQMAADLGEQQQRALRAERLASIGQVAAGVAHEINNPLAVILGYAKMLEKKLQDDSARDTTRVIAEETRRAQRIVDELLDLARPQRLERESADLAALAHEAVESLREAGQLDEIEVSVRGKATAEVDRAKIKQVLINVTRNAAEATRAAGGAGVEIALEAAEGRASVVVRDEGAGADSEALGRAFEPFYSSKAEGVGLGLAVCHAIVDAHSGRIALQNRGDGAGAEVVLSLPAAESR